MIGLIYEYAKSVRVWLGCDTNELYDAFQLIPKIMLAYSEEEAKEVREAGENYRVRPPCSSYYSDEILSGQDNSKSDWDDLFSAQDRINIWDIDFMKSTFAHKEGCESLVRFLERSYWTRIWIVQEYMLAQEVIIQCGGKMIRGIDLKLAFNSIRQLKSERVLDYPPNMIEAIEKINNSAGKRIIERRRLRGKNPLAELIEATKHSKCHDPHDRIYAIIALASDMTGSGKSIPIDYHRSIFKVKMDVAWLLHDRFGFGRSRDYRSRICSLLDEIFADCPDSYYES
jgi:hypothetical protein